VVCAGGEAAAVGVPVTLAVPSPLSVKLSPGGSVPVTLSAAIGAAFVATTKLPAAPVVKGAVSDEEKLGVEPGLVTLIVSVWVCWPTAFCALTVIG